MSGRAIVFIVASLAYWFVGLMAWGSWFLGGLLGDCFGEAACMAAKRRSVWLDPLLLGLLVAIYAGAVAVVIMRRRGRRPA